IIDRAPGRDPYPRKEIITRLQRNRCELCQHSGQVQVHHVARLADLAYPGHGQPAWARLMEAKRRKALVVCPPCHDQIHAERPPAANTLTASVTAEPDARKAGTSGSAGGRTFAQSCGEPKAPLRELRGLHVLWAVL